MNAGRSRRQQVRPARNFLLFGRPDPRVEPLLLRAGPLRMIFEKDTLFLRRLCIGNREVLRAIYAAVRDRNWGTVTPRLSKLKWRVATKSFRLTFRADCRQGNIHFCWRGVISGSSEGVVSFSFDGTALTSFLRNRIGFCVLHPLPECAGAPAHQKRTDGSIVHCCFPETVEPQIFGRASFQNLQGLAHEVAPGLWVEVDFEGDIFEMEDQRNWTDASFKTYCTPLARPFPVEVRAGTRIWQRVTLRLSGDPSSSSNATQMKCDRERTITGGLLDGKRRSSARTPKPGGIRVGLGLREASRSALAAAPLSLVEMHKCSKAVIRSPDPETVIINFPRSVDRARPAIGLGMASHGLPLAKAELARLKALRPDHLRVDVHLGAPAWHATWNEAVREATALGAGLEIAVHLPSKLQGDLEVLRACLKESPAPVLRVLALREREAATTADTLRKVRRALRRLDFAIGAGSDANFCELNREQALGRMALQEADFVFWSINPQVHATDSQSVIENLAAQADTVRTASEFAKGKPLVISPVTLKPRFNAVATGATPTACPDELPPSVDSRQMSLFGAAWTLGSIAALSGAGAYSITFYETTGWRGVMEREAGSPMRERFPSIAGGVFPVFHLLANIAGCSGLAPVCSGTVSNVVAVAGISPRDKRRLIIGNLTTRRQSVRLFDLPPKFQVRHLNLGTTLSAVDNPDGFRSQKAEMTSATKGYFDLSLPPCALACLINSLEPNLHDRP